MQKDVALISLANVLHRGRYSNEAAIVVHAALDVSKELNVNHFTLGNIYAVSGSNIVLSLFNHYPTFMTLRFEWAQGFRVSI